MKREREREREREGKRRGCTERIKRGGIWTGTETGRQRY